MKVYAYLSDQWACGHYRQKFPAQAIDDPGMEVKMISAQLNPNDQNPDESVEVTKVNLHIDMSTGRLRGEEFPRDADVIQFQRPTNAALVQAIPMLQARGVAVVVDIDDDLGHIDPNNPAWFAMHPRTTMGPGMPVMHSWRNLAFACRHATLVTCTTPQLAKVYGSHGRVRVLENCVPGYLLGYEHVDSDVVGWAGSLHSHPVDLQDVGMAVARLVREGARFETVGDPTGIADALGLAEDPPSTGTLDFAEWHKAVAKRIGVGIVPLAHTRFNTAKSWLKGLEYAAIGIPFVASNVDSYVALYREGAGLLAAKPSHWYRQLRELVDSPARRVELGGAARDVARRWTYEDRAWRWAEAWTDATEIVHAQRARYTAPTANRPTQRRGRVAQKGRKARQRRRVT